MVTIATMVSIRGCVGCDGLTTASPQRHRFGTLREEWTRCLGSSLLLSVALLAGALVPVVLPAPAEATTCQDMTDDDADLWQVCAVAEFSATTLQMAPLRDAVASATRDIQSG